MRRDFPWKRDELILALDLYMSIRYTPLASDSDVIRLSKLLRRLPIHPVEVRTDKFRNPNSAVLKCANFQYIDPEVKGGLPAGSKLGEEIWTEFFGRREELHLEAERIKNIANASQELIDQLENIEAPPASEDQASEGVVQTKLHMYRERNASLVNKKKKQALEKYGVLHCEVCNFVYSKKYGKHGSGYIECHHTKPVSELISGEKTHIRDLALVCADCHRMIHRKRPWLSLSELKDLIS